MSRTTIILLVIGGLLGVGALIYFATQGRSDTAPAPAAGQASSIAGLITSIGAGVTGLTATIVGAAEQGQGNTSEQGGGPE